MIKSYHDLKAYALLYFRSKAGFIPPAMPVDHDWLGELRVSVKYASYHQWLTVRNVTYRYFQIGYTDICWDCLYHIRKLMPHINHISICYDVSALNDYQECVLCGKLGIECIPF